MFSFKIADQGGEKGRVQLCASADLVPGRTLLAECQGISLLACRTASGIRVIENRCSHQALPLDRARIMGDEIVCPHHGARFDLRSGCRLSGVAVHPLRVFAASEEGGKVLVELPFPSS